MCDITNRGDLLLQLLRHALRHHQTICLGLLLGLERSMPVAAIAVKCVRTAVMRFGQVRKQLP